MFRVALPTTIFQHLGTTAIIVPSNIPVVLEVSPPPLPASHPASFLPAFSVEILLLFGVCPMPIYCPSTARVVSSSLSYDSRWRYKEGVVLVRIPFVTENSLSEDANIGYSFPQSANLRCPIFVLTAVCHRIVLLESSSSLLFKVAIRQCEKRVLLST